jgi:membrane protein YqaA with SNARE-associated domain
MSDVVLLLSTFAGCLLGSFVPLVNTELVVLGAAAVAPAHLMVPLILVASLSQMIGKSCLYYAGAGLLRLPPGHWSAKLEKATAGAERFAAGSTTLLFASAATGFPPFYLTSVASGVVHLDFRRFLIVGLIGRTLRFTAVVLAPQIIRMVLA